MEAPFLRQASSGSVRRSNSAKFGASGSRAQAGVQIDRYNMGKLKFKWYTLDLFHTLVNMRAYRFFFIFLAVYNLMYVFYALLYFSQPEDCISNQVTLLHAFWFSVHTSATIGYGHMAPRPECTVLNIFIVGQVLTSLLLQAVLLGVVYARFSTPNQRAHTIRFSRIMTMHGGSDGYNRLSFRVANLRKHQVLRPELRMLLLRKQKHGGVDEYIYTDLPTRHAGGGRLWLGVPTVLKHVIDEQSPLYGVTLHDMERRGWELVVLLDGYDESTSMPVQARQAYSHEDIEWDARFEPMIGRRPSGFLGVDFSSFDLTHYAEAGSSEEGGDGSIGGGEDATACGKGLGDADWQGDVANTAGV